MNKLTILIFCLLITNSICGQIKAIKITNQVSKKEIIIKENKRIKIKTFDGHKISGRFQIENNSILIKGQKIELSEIEFIKRNPILVSILTSGFFIYVGAITAGIGVLIGVFADTSAFLLTIPAAVMIFAGIKSPNFSRKFRSNTHWTFEIVTISE